MAEYVTLKKNDGTIIYPQIDPSTINFNNAFFPGQLLVTARNTTTCDPGTCSTHTIMSLGNWSQHGPMADTPSHRIKIANTTGNTMTVLLELTCPTVNTPTSRVSCTGIVECNAAGTAYTSLVGQTILSVNSGATNIWAPVCVRKTITVTAGATRYFAVSCQTNGTGCIWLGNDVKSGSSIGLDTSFGGDSIVLTATLMSLA